MFDAIVVAGGRASRLGGADKPGLVIGGRPLLQRVGDAVAHAGRLVVVGPTRADLLAHDTVVWCREQPFGGGPVAAIAAGLQRVSAPVVLVLAADLPWIGGAVDPLLAAAGTADVAVLTDRSARRNPLAAAWQTAALRAALAGLEEIRDRPARELLTGVRVAEVADLAGWGADCDTWTDVQLARSRQERS